MVNDFVRIENYINAVWEKAGIKFESKYIEEKIPEGGVDNFLKYTVIKNKDNKSIDVNKRIDGMLVKNKLTNNSIVKTYIDNIVDEINGVVLSNGSYRHHSLSMYFPIHKDEDNYFVELKIRNRTDSTEVTNPDYVEALKNFQTKTSNYYIEKFLLYIHKYIKMRTAPPTKLEYYDDDRR